MENVLVFDFDGTIVDSKDIGINIYNEIAEEYNFKKIDNSVVSNLSALSIAQKCKVLGIPVSKIPFWHTR